MNRKKIIILAIIIIVLVGLFYWFLKFTGIYIDNKVNVTVDKSLSIEKVKIEYGFYSINTESDYLLVNQGLKKVIFNGKPKGSFRTICGENDFFIVYDNLYYTIIRHFIPNDFQDGIPDPHNYNFNFKAVGDSIYMTLKIVGTDGEEFERQLERVSNSENNLWGKPKK